MFCEPRCIYTSYLCQFFAPPHPPPDPQPTPPLLTPSRPTPTKLTPPRNAQFFVGMMALVVLPFVLGLGWVALCTRPVQCRVWMPSIFWLTIKVPLVNKVTAAPFCFLTKRVAIDLTVLCLGVLQLFNVVCSIQFCTRLPLCLSLASCLQTQSLLVLLAHLRKGYSTAASCFLHTR